MGSTEFTHWIEWMASEDMGPGSDRIRWAVQTAALHNGPVVRKDKSMFSAEDFLPRRAAERKPRASTGRDARAFLATLRRERH